MTTPDPVDELLGKLESVDPPNLQPQAERAFRNHAEESKLKAASTWRVWGRWVEPVLVGLFVLIFLVWAFAKVLAG